MIILGVLNGEPLLAKALQTLSAGCDQVWAADGGLIPLLEAGVHVEGVIGDFDSIGTTLGDFGGKVVRNSDQDSSDVQKLLAMCSELGASGVVLSCAHGRRMDHMLGVLIASLVPNIEVILAFPQEWCLAIPAAGQWVIPTQPGQRISLMPFGPLRVSLRGTEWELGNALLHGPNQVSISNVATGNSLSLEVHAGQGWLFGGYDQVEVPEWFRLRHSTTS